MILWRLSRRPYADLSGRGGELADGRWHSRGRPIVYCSASAALAVLEVRVHLDLPLDLLPEDYVLMKIEAPDDLEVRTIASYDLPDGWQAREDLCRPIGDAWLDEASIALLIVPSATVEVERNLLVNPKHPDSTRIEITDTLPSRGTSAFSARPLRQLSASTPKRLDDLIDAHVFERWSRVPIELTLGRRAAPSAFSKKIWHISMPGIRGMGMAQHFRSRA